MTHSRIFFSFISCAVFVAAFYSRGNCQAFQDAAILRDEVVWSCDATCHAKISRGGRYAYYWRRNLQDQARTDVSVIALENIEEPFVVSSSNPGGLFFSKKKEKTVFELIAGQNNTLCLSKTVFGLPAEVLELAGVAGTGVIADESMDGLYVFSNDKLLQVVEETGSVRPILLETSPKDTIRSDETGTCVVYFPFNSIDAPFVAEVVGESSLRYILPGTTGYSEQKIVEPDEERQPKLITPPQVYVADSCFDKNSGITVAAAYRSLDGPRVFVWKKDFLIDIVKFPKSSIFRLIRTSGNRVFVLTTSPVNSESALHVYSVSADHLLQSEASLVFRWECRYAELNFPKAQCFAFDAINRLHRITVSGY